MKKEKIHNNLHQVIIILFYFQIIEDNLVQIELNNRKMNNSNNNKVMKLNYLKQIK